VFKTHITEKENVLHCMFVYFQKQKLLLTHEGHPHVAAVWRNIRVVSYL